MIILCRVSKIGHVFLVEEYANGVVVKLVDCIVDTPSTPVIELDDGKIYRKPIYFMVKTMVSCRFSLEPIH